MRRLLPLPLAAAAACADPAKPEDADGADARTATADVADMGPAPARRSCGVDVNHDGKPRRLEVPAKDATGKEIPLRKEKDLNGDGKIDTREKYAPDGSLVRVVYDLDFDGKPDETLFFEKDQLVKKELAFGFDGVPRSWNYYEKGKLVRKERDTNGDGQVDYWEYWENGEVDRIGVDEDGDGQVDRWEAKKTAEAGEGDNAVPAAQAAQQATQK